MECLVELFEKPRGAGPEDGAAYFSVGPLARPAMTQ
jgi:hypothetical protein